MFKTLFAASVLSIATSSTGISMSNQIFFGQVQDLRVEKCGVAIDGHGVVSIRPFIQASADVSGSFHIRVNKRSSAGTSVTDQSGRFTNGSLGA